MSTEGYIIEDRLAQLDEITLNSGGHDSFESGHCAMEVVSWLAGEGFTDAPECASPVLRAFTISLNDNWDDEDRQRLRPYLPRMVGTAGDGQDEARSYLALDWLIRSYTPAWLDLAGLTDEAQELRSLRRIFDLTTVRSAGPVVRRSQEKSSAARAAARVAAGDAAWAAARAAAWDAARVAAGEAAWDSAWDAAWDAAWAAARVAAGHAARVAARAAAGDAAWAAARAAAGDAAWDAAWAALKPTVETLKSSALDLLYRMLDPSQAGDAA